MFISVKTINKNQSSIVRVGDLLTPCCLHFAKVGFYFRAKLIIRNWQVFNN